jgi:parvulin-like peptidyl-prolyl isomerase
MRRIALPAAGAVALSLAAGPAPADPPKFPAEPTKQQGADAPRSPQTGAAATVNGEVIRLDEVDAQIKRRPPLAAPLTAGQSHDLRAAVAQDLIDDLLVKQYMRKHGPKVEPGEIDKYMQALTDSLRARGKTLADYYRELGQTEAQVRETWTALVQFAKLVDREATPDRLRKYYEAFKDHFDRVEVRVSHVVVRVGPAAPPADRAAAKAKLTKLRADILAGAVTFADAARKHSFDPSAAQGGDIGYIPRRDGVADEAFARAAFELKVGDVSEPVETEFGVHLISVTDRKPGTPSTFEKAVEQVKDCYADDVRQALIAKLRKEGNVQVTVP